MNKFKIIIICLIGLNMLTVAYLSPQILKETWGNNDLHYLGNNEYGLKTECDEKLWQPPTNCRFTEEAQRTADLLRQNDLLEENAVLP